MADISKIKLPNNTTYNINAATVNGHTVDKNVPSNAVFTDTLPMAYCDTNAGTTAKVAKCTNFSLKNNSFIPINFKNGNTVASGTGVTLNINNTGAKPVYVDFDDDSVPTDSPFNAGTYILYYTNQAYYLYTNGVLYPYRDVAKQNDLRYYSFGSQDGSVIITEGSSTSGGVTTYTENMSVQKVNGHTVEKDVPSNAVFTDTNTHRPIKVNGSQILGNNTTPFNLVSGDNVRMAITGSGSVTIHSDQIDDSYTYDQYKDLPSMTKMQDKIFMVKDAPNPPAIPIVDEYAREQIVDVKADLSKYKRAVFTGTWTNIPINTPNNKYVDISSLHLQDYSQIMSMTVLTTQPAWIQVGIGTNVSNPSTTQVTLGITNRYSTAISVDYMFIVFYKDN